MGVKLSPVQLLRIESLLRLGLTSTVVAKRMGLHRQSVLKIKARLNITPGQTLEG